MRPEVCVGAIAVRDGCVRLVRRGHGPAAGQWSVPGGRVEWGETLAGAVVREVAEETGLENVGVCIDVGHALYAYENVAESIVILQERGAKLFHMHFNDNYRYWDDDMIVGSVHLVEYIEMLFWLRETGYDGWYSMDQYPYREDGAGAIDASVQFLRSLEKLLDEATMDEIRGLIGRGDPIEASHWLRRKILPQP